MCVHEKINSRAKRQHLEFPDKLPAARYFIELQQDKKLRIFNVAKGYEYETQAIKRYQSAYLAAVPYFLL
jgi:hypothetical protein